MDMRGDVAVPVARHAGEEDVGNRPRTPAASAARNGMALPDIREAALMRCAVRTITSW
jgi:hypothetical protein